MNDQAITYDKSFEIISNIVDVAELASDDDSIKDHIQDMVQSDLLRESKGRHIQTFSARVLDWDTKSVKTEWLINKEEGKYQIRYFPIELFHGTKFLQHGHKLKVFLFVKKNEMKINFEDGSKLVSDRDFPATKNLSGLESKLFNFKRD